MRTKSSDSTALRDSAEELQRNTLGLNQVKASSRRLALNACLQNADFEKGQFLRRWAKLEESHANLLACYTSSGEFGPYILQESPLRLAQDILQQDIGAALSPLFFHSLIGLKQWQVEKAEKLEQQAVSHDDKDLVALFKKLQLEDRRMAGDIISFCERERRRHLIPNPYRSLKIAS